jgi:hypothetical protein
MKANNPIEKMIQTCKNDFFKERSFSHPSSSVAVNVVIGCSRKASMNMNPTIKNLLIKFEFRSTS